MHAIHLSVGSHVGPYRILAPLGAGGMGEVYRARDEKLNRDVALKILSAELASNSDHLRRFEQEAHAASALNHPNIITIYDIGHVEGMAFIAMELVDGQDLRSLQAGDRLPLKNVLRIVTKVSDGLAAAHERGIVHRDLKPENVMISRDGFVKILDFGLAKLVRPINDSQTTAPHTTPGAVFGTVTYMSPEQAAGRNLDFRSDQFSLGVILYELLTGHLPFAEETAPETLAAIIRNSAKAASEWNEEVTPDLQRVLDRCLAKDPAERYASTRDLARDLREIRDRISNSSDPRYRSDKQFARPTRRVAWIGAAAAGVVLVAFGTYMNVHGERPAAAKSRGPASIAVVPFQNVGGTSEGQIFTDGITEMLRSRLGEARSVRVIAAFDSGVKRSPVDVARSLHATYALTGAVERANDDLHLSVSLIDAQSGEQVASETFAGKNSDVFPLENRAADAVLSELNAQRDSGAQHSVATELANVADQTAYIEALGLLQRPRDELAIDRAIATLNNLLLNARDAASVNAVLGRALYFKYILTQKPDLVKQATLYAERASEIDGSNSEVHMTLGELRLVGGRAGDAVTEFERSLSLRSNVPEVVLGLARAYDTLGRGAEAEREYRRAISLRADWPTAYDYYGASLFRRGRFDEAAANFLKVQQLDPSSPRGYTHLGAVYQLTGRYDEAVQQLKRSIAIEPTDIAYSNLGTLQFTLGHYADACAPFEKATQLAPKNYRWWANLGDAYRWSNAKPKAAAAYQRAVAQARETLSVNPRDVAAHAYTAACLAKTGKLDEANSMANAALKIDPTNATALYDAAVVALLRGDKDLAVSWLERAAASGYSVTKLGTDPELTALQNDTRFKTMIEEAKKKKT